MNVVDLKPKKFKRAPRDLVPIDKTSGPARYYERMVERIEDDLDGRRHLSRIETELIRAFAAAATLMQYLNAQVLLGEISEIDLPGYATIASTMLRIGSHLGLKRRENGPPSFGDLLRAEQEAERQRFARERRQTNTSDIVVDG
jgi:hypothetical protein